MKAVSQCEGNSQTNHSSGVASRQIEMRDVSQGQRALDRDVISDSTRCINLMSLTWMKLDERWMQGG